MSTLEQFVTILTIAGIVTFVTNLVRLSLVSKGSVAVRAHELVDLLCSERCDRLGVHIAVVEAHGELVHGRCGLREKLLGVAKVVRKRRV